MQVEPQPPGRRTLVLTAVLSAVVLLSLVVCCGGWTLRGVDPIPFDADVWARSAGAGNTRLLMVDDLLQHHQLVGMTSGEVEALLGPPTDEVWSSAYPMPGWAVGVPDGMSDGSGLMLEFVDERVVRVYTPWR